METLGDRIKKSRINAGYKTQSQVADRLSVIRQTISHWENGTRTPDAESLSKLADLFGVTTDYLLGKESKVVTQEHLLNVNSRIKEEFGENVKVMFHDINSFDDDEMEQLKFAIEMIKNSKRKKTP